MSKALWGGRFKESMSEQVADFNQSIEVDARLFYQDIKGSIAHVTMLERTNIITSDEARQIIDGLEQITQDYEAGHITFKKELEDIHLNIEKLLIEKIGPVGGKMHTARSRNDQVATDMHLYAKEMTQAIITSIKALQQVIISLSKQYNTVIMPGYTHLQRAQPILFSHHIMTYFWMLERDKARFSECIKRINISPLGSGALAGTTFPIDQKYTASLLEFDEVYPNSIDAVSDRDYVLDIMHNINLLMMHLSRFSEEIILWCSEEFKFVTLSDAYTTGSSIMPQKKNPDMAELVRGKSGTVAGNYMGLLMTIKGLPLAYNKDLQEDKKGFFDSVDTALQSIQIFTGMIDTMKVNAAHLSDITQNDFSNATELADYLVTLGIPFRDAHEMTGQLVLYAINNNILLKDIPLEYYQTINKAITNDIYTKLNPEYAVNRRINDNGTSTDSVMKQIEKAEQCM
ncbi:argininosuccinate lyase [Macrococcoides canis]|uniref:argininosuccinate lyase n=1 Tax=Macrococcoides canis TaxID=1855823 RepID=UPI00105EC8F6|nr:argininosuccinate lyase [Macrococcus canis]TDM20771.1 argininosuccinate lyase [Macrococcus canis]